MFEEHLKVKPCWRAGSPHAFALLHSVLLLGLPQLSSAAQKVGPQLPCKAICMLPQSWIGIFASFSGHRGFRFWVVIACSGPNFLCLFHSVLIEEKHRKGKGTSLEGKVLLHIFWQHRAGWDSVNGTVQEPSGVGYQVSYCKSRAASSQIPPHSSSGKRGNPAHMPLSEQGFNLHLWQRNTTPCPWSAVQIPNPTHGNPVLLIPAGLFPPCFLWGVFTSLLCRCKSLRIC